MITISSILINGINVTSSIPTEISFQDRCDGAFAYGSCQAYLKGSTWKYNITPFTQFEINWSNGTSKRFVCKSTCNAFLPETDLYVHDIEIMDATAMLSNFIVGTKVFSTTGSNTYDYEKVNVMLQLINQKSGYTFITDSTLNSLNKKIFYSFGAGSTLYDNLNEIARHYNKKVRVNTFSYHILEITFDDLGLSDTYTASNVTKVEYTQNDSKYGNTLETEATNVVDRTTEVIVDNVICRGEEFVVNSDNSHLEMPTTIEEIKELKVHCTADLDFKIFANFYDSTGKELDSSGETEYTVRALWNAYNGNKFYNLYTNVFSRWISSTQFRAMKVRYYYDALGVASLESSADSDTAQINYLYDLTDRVLHKSKWDLLTDQLKCSYAFYTGSDNKILNMYSSYKNDVISKVMGHTGLPFLANRNVIEVTGQVINGITYNYGLGNYSIKVDPSQNVYYCKYIGINESPYLYHTKRGTDSFSRSYACEGGLIDFDKIAENMAITNDSEGNRELTLEINSSDNDFFYESRKKITYDSTDWYISSVITTISQDKITSTLNCVKEYNKVAECVAVETQFTATKNPLNAVVVRPINLGEGTLVNAYDKTKQHYMRLTFKFADNTTKEMFVPCGLMESDSQRLFYCEAQDNYSIMMSRGDEFDFNIITWTAGLFAGDSAKQYYQEYNAYVDTHNECKYVKCDIVYISSLTKAQAFALPAYTGECTIVYSGVEKLVYKDAREQLTFTFKVNK